MCNQKRMIHGAKKLGSGYPELGPRSPEVAPKVGLKLPELGPGSPE